MNKVREELVIAQITGKFATADAEFGPGNKLLLALRLDSDIRNCLINVTPTIVTEETATKLRVLDVQDAAEPRPYRLVHGKHPFLIFGVNMVLNDLPPDLGRGRREDRHRPV